MSARRRLTRRQFVRCAAAGAASGYWLGCAAPGPRAAAPLTREEAAVQQGDWDGLAGICVQRIRRSGAEYGDIRLIETVRHVIRGQDGRIEDVRETRDAGFGVRVLYGGGWGFAASPIFTPEEVRATTELAIEIARASATLALEPVRLAPEPPHQDAVASPREIDPFSVPLEQKTGLLLAAMEAMQKVEGIRRTRASLWAQRDLKMFASTEGALVAFDLLASHGAIGATAVCAGRFASREHDTPHLRAGWELIRDANFEREATRVAEQAVEKCQAPAVEAGEYDLVLDPAHLALTIHESCGHPSELDRALGYEANYAGTSFLTPEKLGRFRYGSPQVSLVADNTEPGGLASTGYDDDGVAGQRWDIVREGVFAGYSTNREVAPKIGEGRSRGSCRADGWSSIPILRIANVGLEPGAGTLDDLIGDVKRGIYIEGAGSFSIDQKRYNFQFGGDAFWLIENGQRKHMLRDVIYTGITPEFWGSCDAVADRAHRRMFGFITCGKGQPGQSGWMTHAASPARFRGVNVIRGATAS